MTHNYGWKWLKKIACSSKRFFASVNFPAQATAQLVDALRLQAGRSRVRFDILVLFDESAMNLQNSLQSANNNRYFTCRPIYIFWSYLAQFFLEWEMFQTKVVQKIKIHILCSVTFFRKSCSFWDNVGKYNKTEQTTDDNKIRCHW